MKRFKVQADKIMMGSFFQAITNTPPEVMNFIPEAFRTQDECKSPTEATVG